MSDTDEDMRKGMEMMIRILYAGLGRDRRRISDVM